MTKGVMVGKGRGGVTNGSKVGNGEGLVRVTVYKNRKILC